MLVTHSTHDSIDQLLSFEKPPQGLVKCFAIKYPFFLVKACFHVPLSFFLHHTPFSLTKKEIFASIHLIEIFEINSRKKRI
jgi:hypothetical protein